MKNHYWDIGKMPPNTKDLLYGLRGYHLGQAEAKQHGYVMLIAGIALGFGLCKFWK